MYSILIYYKLIQIYVYMMNNSILSLIKSCINHDYYFISFNYIIKTYYINI